MSSSEVDRAIWLAGMCSQLSLLAVLVIRRRWAIYPLFTVFVVHQNLFTLALIVINRPKHPEIYRVLYWLSEALCFLFEAAVTMEVFGILLRAVNRPAPIVRLTLIRWSIFSFSLAFISAWSVGSPEMPLIDLLAMRGSTFTSFLLCGCFICVSIYAASMHIRRPAHAMVIGWGLTVIALLELVEDFRFFDLGWHRGSDVFDHLKSGSYVLIVLYWTMGLWSKCESNWPFPLSLSVKQTSQV